MKKLILGMVFVLLTALFIGFNYLLWDRESRENELKNLENANASNNASISAQKREIGSLEEENSNQKEEIERLENENEKLLQDKIELASERDEVGVTLQERINFINALKLYADIKTLSEPVTKWVEALNQGKYEEAYEFEYAGVLNQARKVSLAEYTEEMKNTIRKVEIGEVKLDKLRGSGNGEIFLEVRLNIKLAEDTSKAFSRYIEGANDMYIKVLYSYEKKAFIISTISNT